MNSNFLNEPSVKDDRFTMRKPSLLELSTPTSPATSPLFPISKTDVENSKEYKSLLLQFNKAQKQLTEIQAINQKKFDDMIELYEDKLSILETKLKKEEKNSKVNDVINNNKNNREERLRTINCQCDLLYDLGVEGLNNGPNSSKLRHDFDEIMNEVIKKLENERLEIDIRRIEFRNTVVEFDSGLEKNKSIKMGNAFKNVFFLKEPIKIKSEQLNKLLSDCDEKIVELSKIFLNEKVDLIFEQKKHSESLKRQLADMELLNKKKLLQIEKLEKDILTYGQKLTQSIETQTETEQNQIVIIVDNHVENAFTQTENTYDSKEVPTKIETKLDLALSESKSTQTNSECKNLEIKELNPYLQQKNSCKTTLANVNNVLTQTDQKESEDFATQTEFDFISKHIQFNASKASVKTQTDFVKNGFQDSFSQTENPIFTNELVQSQLKLEDKNTQTSQIDKSLNWISTETQTIKCVLNDAETQSEFEMINSQNFETVNKNGIDGYDENSLKNSQFLNELSNSDEERIIELLRISDQDEYLNQPQKVFEKDSVCMDSLKLNELLMLEKKFDYSNAENKQLNEIIIELKIIIAKMYEKMVNFKA